MEASQLGLLWRHPAGSNGFHWNQVWNPHFAASSCIILRHISLSSGCSCKYLAVLQQICMHTNGAGAVIQRHGGAGSQSGDKDVIAGHPLSDPPFILVPPTRPRLNSSPLQLPPQPLYSAIPPFSHPRSPITPISYCMSHTPTPPTPQGNAATPKPTLAGVRVRQRKGAAKATAKLDPEGRSRRRQLVAIRVVWTLQISTI